MSDTTLEAFSLFDAYAGEGVEVLEPAWVLDTLGPHWGVGDNGHFCIEHFNGMSYHIIPGTRARAAAEEVVDIVGPNCAGDLIQLKRWLPRFSRGDLLIMLDVGAYNLSYANQFNGLPRPAMCLVNGSKVAVIRERESITDVFARHRMPDWLLRP